MSRRSPARFAWVGGVLAVFLPACSLGLDWTPTQSPADAAVSVDATSDVVRRDGTTDDAPTVVRCGAGDTCPAGLRCCNNMCRQCCNNTDCAGNPTGGYCCPNAGYTCRQCCEDNQCTQGGTRNCCNNLCQQRGCG